MSTTAKLNPERKSEIDNICDTLFKAGGMAAVSVRKVLEQIPGISSTSTINPYVSAWKNEQKHNAIDMFEQLGLSDNFKSMFFQEMHRITSVREDMHLEEIRGMQADIDIANELLLKKEVEVSEMAQAVDSEKKESDRLSHLVTEANSLLREREASYKSELENKGKTLRETMSEVTDINSKYMDLYGTVSSLKTDKANLEASLKVSSDTISELTTKLESAVQQSQEMQKQITTLEVQNETVNSQLSELKALLKEGREIQISTENALAIKNSEYEKLDVHYQSMMVELEDANTLVIETRQMMDTSNQKLHDTKKALTSLKKRSDKQANDNQMLIKEVEQFQQDNSQIQKKLAEDQAQSKD